MNFTKIKPVEFNGQRVAPVSYLTDYLVETCGITGPAARTRIATAQRKFAEEGVDYFKVDGYRLNFTNPAYQNLYTNSGVLKLSNFRSVSPLKDFVAVYFDTDALPATEPAKVEMPDVTNLIPVDSSFETFANSQFGSIRTTIIGDKPFFVGKDVALALGYSNYRDALARHVDDEDKRVSRFPTPSGTQEMTVINESGLYSLILSSKLPAAKEFKHWVTSEVLPAIRKTGAYVKPVAVQTPFDYEEAIDKAIRIKDKIRRFVGVGVKDEMLLAQAVYMTEKFFNQDLSAVRNCIPAATHKIGYMNATEVGAKVGKSNREINKLAVEKGVAFRDDKKVLRLTELGKKYGESVAFEKNGHSDYQIKWNDDAVAFFADNVSLFN